MTSLSQTIKATLRPWAGEIFRVAMRLHSQPAIVPPGTTIIVVAPHPDDETFGCGSFLSHQIKLGRAVHVVLLTDGAASHPGHPDLPPAKLASFRLREFGEALAALGIDPLATTRLNLPDGRLDRLEPDLRQRAQLEMNALTQKQGRQLWLLPSPHDGSKEHAAAHAMTLQALDHPQKRIVIWEYFVWAWRNPLRFLPVLKAGTLLRHKSTGSAAKSRALSAYRSQTTAIAPWTTPVLEPSMTRILSRDEEFFHFHQ